MQKSQTPRTQWAQALKQTKQEIQERIDFIKKYPSAEYIIIDGQSRGYLSIVKFFQNEIQFYKSFTLRRKNKKTKILLFKII